MSSYLAQHRFGLGPKGSDRPIGDPQRWLRAQITDFDPEPATLRDLPALPALAQAMRDYTEAARAIRSARADRPDAAAAPEMAGDPMMTAERAAPTAEAAELEAMRRDGRRALRGYYTAAADARLATAVASTTPFMDRWVHFWANHFAVSVEKLVASPFAGDLEFSAIRRHARGRFVDLLKAAALHPAMLLYLDQAQSIGPDSPMAERINGRGARRGGNRPPRSVGLNENLAREILELHSLGVRSGYTQADVTAFARALTGYTVAGVGRGAMQRLLPAGASDGNTVFVEAMHQPGAHSVMGRNYSQSGGTQALAILDDLAAHPATARHIATKLARHFVADDPPASLVIRLEQSFLRSGGNLAELATTLIASPEAWDRQYVKFKSPWDWGVSALRALGVAAPEGGGRRRAAAPSAMFVALGQPIWQPGAPAGWGDTAATWTGPAALIERVDMADRLAGFAPAGLDPRSLATSLLGDALTPALATAIARAESPAQGLAMLLVSPPFLRR